MLLVKVLSFINCDRKRPSMNSTCMYITWGVFVRDEFILYYRLNHYRACVKYAAIFFFVPAKCFVNNTT